MKSMSDHKVFAKRADLKTYFLLRLKNLFTYLLISNQLMFNVKNLEYINNLKITCTKLCFGLYNHSGVCVYSCFPFPQHGTLCNVSLLNIIPCQEISIYAAMFMAT